MSLTPCAIDLGIQQVHEMSPVVQAGQFIGLGQLRKAAVGTVQILSAFADRGFELAGDHAYREIQQYFEQ